MWLKGSMWVYISVRPDPPLTWVPGSTPKENLGVSRMIFLCIEYRTFAVAEYFLDNWSVRPVYKVENNYDNHWSIPVRLGKCKHWVFETQGDSLSNSFSDLELYFQNIKLCSVILFCKDDCRVSTFPLVFPVRCLPRKQCHFQNYCEFPLV